MSAGDFQDISPVTVCFETDKGALHALLDDPILLRRETIEDDRSNFYLIARLRANDHLRKARDESPEFTPLIAAALLLYCEGCYADPGEPCVSEDGSTVVPAHSERVDEARRLIGEVGQKYMTADVKIDGP